MANNESNNNNIVLTINDEDNNRNIEYLMGKYDYKIEKALAKERMNFHFNNLFSQINSKLVRN